MIESLTGFRFFCYFCGVATPLCYTGHCDGCGSPLSIQPENYPDPSLFDRRPLDLWHFRELLPLPADVAVEGLGEGATPLLGAANLTRSSGAGEVRLKNEMTNPTGSFKDRQISVGMHWAKCRGFDTVAVVSSGNVAASAAAYSARMGLKAVLFMHGQAAQAKIAQAQAYGAMVVAVDDPSPRAVFELCIEACAARGWYHLSTAGIYEPWNVEGAKTIAYELYQQYGGDLPDWIVAPVGGGGLLGGIWRGFVDLQAMGFIRQVPRMAGVQATGCAPLVEAVENDWTLEEHLAHPWAHPDTIAGAIADDILFDGHTVLPAVRQSWGTALAVDDEEMQRAQQELARLEGLLCEIASASAVAAIRRLPMLDNHTRICCIVSGSGLKDLGVLAAGAAPVPRIPATQAALATITALSAAR